MKALVALFSVLSIASSALASDSIVADATVIKAETNAMFPVSIYRLTVMVGCADKIESKTQVQENGVTKLGVKVRYSTAAACLALPRPVAVDFQVDAFNGPAKVEIIEAAPGLEVEIAQL